MDDTQFKELRDELLVIEKLLALNLVKDVKLRKDQVLALSLFGFKSPKIAELLGTTSGAVRAHLSHAKKETGKVSRKGK